MGTGTGHEQAALLAQLIMKWGDYYSISFSAEQYHAERRDNGARTHALDATELELAIEEDYAAGPRPAGVPPVNLALPPRAGTPG